MAQSLEMLAEWLDVHAMVPGASTCRFCDIAAVPDARACRFQAGKH